LFCEKGFADTTMDQIAARVDLTKPSLYSYFRGEANFKGKYDREIKGKREILLTCLDEAVNACTIAIVKSEKDTSSPGDEHKTEVPCRAICARCLSGTRNAVAAIRWHTIAVRRAARNFS